MLNPNDTLAANAVKRDGTAESVLVATLMDVANTALQVLGADTVDLYEYHADIGTFSLPPIMLGNRLVPGIVPEVIRTDDVVMKIVRDGLEIFVSDARDMGILVEEWIHDREHLPPDRFVIRERIASTAAIAIRVESETVGVLFVGYRTPRDFDGESELRDRVHSFARFAGTAIQNARLLEREGTLRRQSDALARIASAINRRESLIEVAEQILDSIRSVVPYIKASFHVVHGDQRTLVAGRGFDRSRSDLYLSRSTSDDPLIGRVMSQHAPLILSYCKQDRDWQIHPDTEDVESWIGLCVSSGAEKLGLVTLDYDVAGFYRPELAPLMTAFGDQAAIAITEARSIDEIKDRSTRFERLQRVAQAIAAETSDLQRVLKLVVDELAASYPNASCSIRLYDPKTDYFEPQVATGVLQNMLPDQPEPEGTSRHVIMTGRPRFLSGSELIDPPDGGPPVKERVLKQGVLATAYLPLKVEGEAQGVLYLDVLTPYAFSDADEEFLKLFSDQAAVAIRNARLIERQWREREERIRAIREIGFGISTNITLQDVLDGLLDKTLSIFGKASQGQICLIDETGLKLRVVSLRGEEATHVVELEIGQGIAGRVAATGIPRVVPDVSTETDYYPHLANTKSEIAVPLLKSALGSEVVVGVLNIEHSEKNAFSADDIPLLQAIATQAVVAIDNARLLEELNLRAERLEKIQKISLDLSAEESDLNQIMKIAVEGLSQIVPGSSCSIRFLDPETGKSSRLIATGPLQGRGGKPRRHGTTIYVLTTKQPLYIEDTSHTSVAPNDVPTIKRRLRDQGIRAIAYLPLISQGIALGVLYLNLDRPHHFAPDERQLLQMYASQVAASVDTAKQIEYIKQDLKTTTARLDTLTEIFELTIDSGTYDLDRILNTVYEETARIIDLSNVLFYVALYDQKRDEVSFGLAIEKHRGQTIDETRWGKRDGEEVKEWMPRARREPPGLTEYVIREKRPVLIPKDFAEDSNRRGIRPWDRIGKLERSTQSWLGVPMLFGGKISGVISIQDLEHENAFNDKHEALLTRLAAEAADAIDSARLYAAGRDDAIAGKQLDTLGTALAALGHRINNSASVINPNVNRLRKRVDTSDSEIEEILSLIDRNATDTVTIINRVLEPLREIQAQSVDLNAVINDVMKEYAQKHPDVVFERFLAVEVPLLHVSIGQITEIIGNLVENACRAMNGIGVVRASSCVENNCVQIRIEDTGPGIPPEVQQRLFIRPVPSSGSKRSSGLGLWLSQLILQSLNGSIRIEKSDSAGTVMLVEFPVRDSSKRYD